MSWWKVSTENKKSAWEHMLFEKDGQVIRYITGYRVGSVFLCTEESNLPPLLEQNSGPSADMVNVYDTEYEYDLDALWDGWYNDIIFPDDMPEEEREALQTVIDEDVFELEQLGWINYETECWFEGPLKIEPA